MLEIELDSLLFSSLIVMCYLGGCLTSSDLFESEGLEMSYYLKLGWNVVGGGGGGYIMNGSTFGF